MKMKKMAYLLAMAMIVLVVPKSHALMLGIYQKGALVPSVTYTATTNTVVGIICQLNCSPDENLRDPHDADNPAHHGDKNSILGDEIVRHAPIGRIHWTFFDVDSHHKLDGYLECTDDEFIPFNWKAKAGPSAADKQGYLVFSIESKTNDDRVENWAINANAFYLDSANNDVAYIPVVPLASDDLNGKGEVTKLTYGIRRGHRFDLRYWVPAEANAQTTLVIWLTDPIVNGKGKAVTQDVFVWNDLEDGVSTSVRLPHELNFLDPCNTDDFEFWPGYTDGFISFKMPASVDGVAYSVVWSDKVGAAQTLLAAECGSNSTRVVYEETDQNKKCCAPGSKEHGYMQ